MGRFLVSSAVSELTNPIKIVNMETKESNQTVRNEQNTVTLSDVSLDSCDIRQLDANLDPQREEQDREITVVATPTSKPDSETTPKLAAKAGRKKRAARKTAMGSEIGKLINRAARYISGLKISQQAADRLVNYIVKAYEIRPNPPRMDQTIQTDLPPPLVERVESACQTEVAVTEDRQPPKESPKPSFAEMASKGGSSKRQRDKGKGGSKNDNRPKAPRGQKQGVTSSTLRTVPPSLILSRNKGVLLVTQTLSMKEKLNEALRSCNEVEQKVNISDPKGRDPHIIVHNFERSEEDREKQASRILRRLRKSNALPDGEMRVKFRLRGRGNSESWIIAVTPEIFQVTSTKTRLNCGFSSHPVQEFLQPTMCFKCFRFGHIKAVCQSSEERCPRCTGSHAKKDCKRDTPKCPNCSENNKKYKSDRATTNHSALDRKCSTYLREAERLKRNTNYG
ncbi:hypothetical protein HNY73_007766 [Argiope bruennichi]|uniref:Gag-like protein n=1 Tax=Argiope bruennichi TaxID=94029 RepID=A0A8T0FEX4_ARGBR|nr:hypothetical protein HNY73_007766 [Argiope bruennichi]